MLSERSYANETKSFTLSCDDQKRKGTRKKITKRTKKKKKLTSITATANDLVYAARLLAKVPIPVWFEKILKMSSLPIFFMEGLPSVTAGHICPFPTGTSMTMEMYFPIVSNTHRRVGESPFFLVAGREWTAAEKFLEIVCRDLSIPISTVTGC